MCEKGFPFHEACHRADALKDKGSKAFFGLTVSDVLMDLMSAPSTNYRLTF